MKIVVLNGSPRKGGNTEIMTQAFTKGAEKKGHEVVNLPVGTMKIRGCMACEYCFSHNGECAQKDDMTQVYEKLKDADMVVFASPIYWFDITAQLKAVIDRLYVGATAGFHFHKPCQGACGLHRFLKTGPAPKTPATQRSVPCLLQGQIPKPGSAHEALAAVPLHLKSPPQS